MADPVTFETRLAAALNRYADGGPVEVDSAGLAALVATTEPRRWAVGRIGRLGRERPRLVLAFTAVLLTVVLVAAIAVVGGRLVEPRPTPSPDRPSPTAQPVVRPDAFVLVGAGKARRPAAAVALQDGRALLIGGADDATDSPLATAEVFEPSTGTFRSVGSMSNARLATTATVFNNGRVLVVGGIGDGKTLEPTNAELYDPATDRFTQTAPLPEGADTRRRRCSPTVVSSSSGDRVPAR